MKITTKRVSKGLGWTQNKYVKRYLLGKKKKERDTYWDNCPEKEISLWSWIYVLWIYVKIGRDNRNRSEEGQESFIGLHFFLGVITGAVRTLSPSLSSSVSSTHSMGLGSLNTGKEEGSEGTSQHSPFKGARCSGLLGSWEEARCCVSPPQK